MTSPTTTVTNRLDRFGPLFLAALAYLPAFGSAPGRVPADTKLYLYLDPGRLLSDALWSWDDRQFAGWVPHQTIGYLWPSGPWFWTMQRLGVPDWVAHRLWIGTILFAAGMGVRWCARRFGLAPAGVLLAALIYQLSPFVLPYISRTSVLLLPWAGLGWLVGLTMAAARRGGWRDPALFALVVVTVGGINATAMAMIAPAPLLWLADAAIRRELSWRQAVVTALKLGGAAVVVSLWWLVALGVQALFGAPVLNYTETLDSVSFTAVSTEALRGLGYWLFYVRDQTGPLTTMAVHYQLSTVVMAAGFLVILAGLVGLVAVRWRPRRFLAASLLVGVVLAVGAHPIDDPSPLGTPLAESATSTLTLALRSSTRAVPLAVLALALGAGALVSAGGLVRPRLAGLGAGLIAVLAVVNLPALRAPQFVDPVLARDDGVPSAWQEVADALTAAPDGFRTLQLPGTESAVARWGQTVDPVLPGLTDRSVVQRDWLPLGSAPAMDLFYALDDRFQDGTLEPAAIAPVARWFGADSVVYAGDVAFDKFRTARPEPTWSVYAARPAGLGEPVTYGAPLVNRPAVPMLDDRALGDPLVGTEVPELAVVPVEAAEPIVTVRTGTTLVLGSGSGLVGAAAAGILDGTELIRSAAALDAAQLADALADAEQVVLTDSNRKQAHHWRGSQDALGYVEREFEEPLVLDAADHRLPVFPDQDADDQTVAIGEGPILARATAYGEPAAYRPEDRPALAVDGDPTTAWRVADRAEPLGHRLRLDLEQVSEVGTITVLQPREPSAGRSITEIEVRTETGSSRVALDETSRSEPGQVIGIGTETSWIELVITATDLAVRPSYLGFGPVGFAEVGIDQLGPTTETWRLPLLPAALDPSTPLSILTERWRVDPTNRWRTDPEPALRRTFGLPTAREFTSDVVVRVARRADPEVLDELLGFPVGIVASTQLAGTPTAAGWAAFDDDPDTAWTTGFGLALGASVLVPLEPETEVAALAGTFRLGDQWSTATELTLSVGTEERRIRLDPDAGSFSTAFAPMTGDQLTITISAVADRFTTDRRTGEGVALPVAVAEFDLAGAPVVRLPATIELGCRRDLLELDGRPLAVTLRGTTTELLTGAPFTASPCTSGAISAAAGDHELIARPGTETGLDIDRVVLRSGTPEVASTAPIGTVRRDRASRTVEVGPCPDGCWLVSGDGWNEGWTANIGARSLGRPEAVNGGFNGWWVPPSPDVVTVTVAWTPQRRIWLGLAVSIIAVLGALATVIRTRRRPAPVEPLASPRLRRVHQSIGFRPVLVPFAGLVLGGLVITPMWGLVTFGVALVATMLRRPAMVGVVGVVVLAGVALHYVQHQRDGRHLPGFGWVVNVESTHRVTLFALVCVAVGALNDRRVAGRDPGRR